MRKILAVSLTTILTLNMLIPTYAATQWNINPDDYDRKAYNDMEWFTAESLEATQKWVDERKGSIGTLATEREKYDAIVAVVTDFFTYDEEYATLIDTYGYRDGKGVCQDYARSTKALCDAVGLKCAFVIGYREALGEHAWNRVTIDGVDYNSDLGQYDADKDEAYRLCTGLWNGYTEYVALDEPGINTVVGAHNKTYEDGGDMPEPGSGLSRIIKAGGEVVYISQADADANFRGEISWEELCEKYPALR